ncbi:MAG: 5'-deoxynucleotidase [Clostridia bacterium]|nr:5'-deoxynucleotidase [Clostridia bacterium]
MNNEFYAMISRMKYIDRWALMRNTESESLMQHSYEAAVVAHALAVIGNKRFNMGLDADRAAVVGMFHDAPEILTGDMPTPVKYYNPIIRDAYKDIEKDAVNELICMLPEDLRDEYEEVFETNVDDPELLKIVKAADKICALIKCIEEEKAGNTEFRKAKEATEAAIHAMDCPAAEVFLSEFIPQFSLTLDQLR